MSSSNKYSPEVRERAVRMVLEHQREEESQWAAIGSIAAKIGCTSETLRKWVRQAERDQGRRPGLTRAERERLEALERDNRELRRERLEALERENRELRRANEILPKASLSPYRDCLLKRLESFETVVVPTSGIRLDLADAHAHWKHDQNVECWAEPTIRTWQEHIRYVWGMSSHEFSGRRLLSPIEFRYHWMNAGIRAFENLPGNGATPDLEWKTRYASDICDDAVSTWKFVNTYEINLTDQKDDHTLKGRFRAWVDEYRTNAEANGWISDAELARALHNKFSQELPDSNNLFPRYEPGTLFITLPGEEDDRIEYIEKAIHHNAKNESIELTCESSNNGGVNHKIRFVKFDTINEEIEAAAAWALRQLELNAGNDSVPTSPRRELDDSIRIGIVIPNTGQNTLAVERQFLATFYPDGYRAWETPQFRIAEARSLVDTYACQQVLSYIRTRYARRIDYAKARDFLRSGRRSGFVPRTDLEKVEQKLSDDDGIRTSFEAPESWRTETVSANLDTWMVRFRLLIKCSLATSQSNIRSKFGNRLYGLISKRMDTGRRPSLDDLIEALRPSTRGDIGEAELFEVLTRIREPGADAPGDSTPPSKDENLLSRLEQLIERINETMTCCRLLEVVENLRQIAHREIGRMNFGQAYAFLRSACRGEMLSSYPGACPVEILSLEQAVGRHFTHLWVMGMRDTDWPPPVRTNPLLDMELSRSHKAAAKLFDHDDCYRRALADLLVTTAHCSNSDAIVFSYAGRDSGTDRVFMPSRGLSALRSGWNRAGFAGTQYESLMWTDSSGFRRYEFLDDYAFHPVYSGVEERRRDRSEWFPEDYEDNVPLLDGKANYDALATQFECPFRAFAIHRLSVKQRRGRSGREGIIAAENRMRELCEEVKKSAGTDRAKEPWPQCLEPTESADPTGERDHGIFWFVSKDTNGVTRKYIVDCRIGLHGDFETENLTTDSKKHDIPLISEIKKDSFESLLKREKYYPIRVLQYAVKPSAKDEYVGYIVGKKNTERLEVVKYFETTNAHEPGDGGSKSGTNPGVTTLPQFFENLRNKFKAGVMKPDPIGLKRNIPGDEGLPVCRKCQFRAACRYHLGGELPRARAAADK